MAEQTASSADRRTRTRDLVNRILKERQELLVDYCQVAGLEPYTPDKRVASHLRDFCQVLVDYVATVHFELYNRLTEGNERRAAVLRIAEDGYPVISDTTQRVVDFNDRYEKVDPANIPGALPGDLSQLGELLATRFEMEDKLFSALLAGSR